MITISYQHRESQPKVMCFPETRVWNKVGSDWKCVHIHRSSAIQWPEPSSQE